MHITEEEVAWAWILSATIKQWITITHPSSKAQTAEKTTKPAHSKGSRNIFTLQCVLINWMHAITIQSLEYSTMEIVVLFLLYFTSSSSSFFFSSFVDTWVLKNSLNKQADCVLPVTYWGNTPIAFFCFSFFKKKILLECLWDRSDRFVQRSNFFVEDLLDVHA